MKFKSKTYEIKSSVPIRTKPKNVKKPVVPKINKKRIVGIKDHRKYQNDTTLSEAEKISRRMALEKMKRESNGKNQKPKSGKNFFDNEVDEDDLWTKDPLKLKMNQIGQFDEGINESSEEDESGSNDDEDDDKIFTTETSRKKMTLGEKIRESKLAKFEKNRVKAEFVESTIEANEKFRDEVRFILPKLGSIAKQQSSKSYDVSESKFEEAFQRQVESFTFAKKPPRAETTSLRPLSDKSAEKENEKRVNSKIRRLKEHLSKEGIIKLMTDEELSESEDEDDAEGVDEEEDSDDEEGEEEGIEEDEEDVDGEDGEEENNDNCVDLDNEDRESDGSGASDDDDLSSNDEKEIDNSDQVLGDLKKMILQSNKKRKLDQSDVDEGETTKKKLKMDSKNEVDCLRVLLNMPEIQRHVLVVLADQLCSTGCVAWEDKDTSRKLILATILGKALQETHEYSPELIQFLRKLLENILQNPLLDEIDLTTYSRDQLLDICNLSSGSGSLVRVSMMFHACDLLISVINCYRTLSNRRSLFAPFSELIDRLLSAEIERYPQWLVEKMEQAKETVAKIAAEIEAPLRMSRTFKIIQLLEPQIDDKFDPMKNLTKSLKEKVKKEKAAVKKDIKQKVTLKISDEMLESKKRAQFIKKKTQEIMNGIIQV